MIGNRNYWVFLICASIAAYAAGRSQASCQAEASPIVHVTFDDRVPTHAEEPERSAPQVIEVPCAYMGTEMDRYNSHAYLHDLGLDVSPEEQWLMLCMNECYDYLDFKDCAAHCMAKEAHLTCK